MGTLWSTYDAGSAAGYPPQLPFLRGTMCTLIDLGLVTPCTLHKAKGLATTLRWTWEDTDLWH